MDLMAYYSAKLGRHLTGWPRCRCDECFCIAALEGPVKGEKGGFIVPLPGGGVTEVPFTGDWENDQAAIDKALAGES